jgi:hypothetical protein
MPSFKTAVGMLTKDAVLRETEKVDVVSFTVASSTYSQGKPVPDYVETTVFINKNDTTGQKDVIKKLVKGRFVVILNGSVNFSTYKNKDEVEVKKEQVFIRSLYDVIMDPTVDKLKAKLEALEGTNGGDTNISSDFGESDDEIPI